jgi:hypothetical protein
MRVTSMRSTVKVVVLVVGLLLVAGSVGAESFIVNQARSVPRPASQNAGPTMPVNGFVSEVLISCPQGGGACSVVLYVQDGNTVPIVCTPAKTNTGACAELGGKTISATVSPVYTGSGATVTLDCESTPCANCQ